MGCVLWEHGVQAAAALHLPWIATCAHLREHGDRSGPPVPSNRVAPSSGAAAANSLPVHRQPAPTRANDLFRQSCIHRRPLHHSTRQAICFGIPHIERSSDAWPSRRRAGPASDQHRPRPYRRSHLTASIPSLTHARTHARTFTCSAADRGRKRTLAQQFAKQPQHAPRTNSRRTPRSTRTVVAQPPRLVFSCSHSRQSLRQYSLSHKTSALCERPSSIRLPARRARRYTPALRALRPC